MLIPFVKYHGTGNDFILVEGRYITHAMSTEMIALWCHRHFGIGADGLIVVRPAQDMEDDYIMEYYNADGRLGSMCGNGARCAYHFARSIGLARAEANFSAYDGP